MNEFIILAEDDVVLSHIEVSRLVDYLEGRCVRDLAQPVIDKLIKEVE